MEFVVRVRPVYVRAGGAVAPAARALTLTGGTARFILHTMLGDLHTFDWDGDHRAELFFSEAHSQEENNQDAMQRDRAWTYSASPAGVREFAPSHAPLRVTDADGDGRPDLVLGSPWVTAGPCGLADVYYPGPESLLHSLPDGTFSASDAVAQGFIAQQCRVRPTRVLPEDETHDASDETPAYRIGCARWWGRSAEEVTREIERTYTTPAADSGGGEALGCFPRAVLLRAEERTEAGQTTNAASS